MTEVTTHRSMKKDLDQAGVRIPPVVELVIEAPPWNDIPCELLVNSTWDWRRSLHLELRGRAMMHFLRQNQGQIHSLKTLIIQDFYELWEVAGPDGSASVPHKFLSSVLGLKALKLHNFTLPNPISPICRQ